MRQVGGLATLCRGRCRDPADLVKVAFLVGRPCCAVLFTDLPCNGPDALMEDKGLFLLEGALDGVPAHGSVVDRGHALLGVTLVPAKRLGHFGLREDQLAGLFVHEFYAIGLEDHQVVDADIRAVQHAVIGGLAIDDFLGKGGQVVERELAGFDLGGQTFDKGFVLTDLAQHVLVVEEHADFCILRHAIDLAVRRLG
ncbi:hypothetical protein D3C80_561300 [compost metagenome]